MAGTAFGKTSELKAYSPMTFLVMNAQGAGTFAFNKISGHEHAVYVVKGSLQIGDTTLETNEMMVFKYLQIQREAPPRTEGHGWFGLANEYLDALFLSEKSPFLQSSSSLHLKQSIVPRQENLYALIDLQKDK